MMLTSVKLKLPCLLWMIRVNGQYVGGRGKGQKAGRSPGGGQYGKEVSGRKKNILAG